VITPEKAVAACTRAAELHARTTEWPGAVHATVRSLIDRLAVAKGLTPPLRDTPMLEAETVLNELGPLDGWHILDLGEIHQRLLELTPHQAADGTVTARRDGLGRRDGQGAWYTPPEAVEAMCRLTLGPYLERLEQEPHPGALFDLLVMDPACGAGVFLVEAARLIAGRLAARVTGCTPAPKAHVRAALRAVMPECIFGVDIDPVAVDLTKAALWLETGGREPFGFMDRNVIVGNALDDEMPPAFTERRGDPPTAPERRTAGQVAA
jgi:hypothetical protein